MHYFYDNWLTILTLVIAPIGGVPGLIAIANERKNRPIFSFALLNVSTGQLSSSPRDDTPFLLVTGTARNDGKTPLTPAFFRLRCKINGSWIEFERMLIPESAKFQSERHTIDVAATAQSDMQRFAGTIGPGMPLQGHMFFLTTKLSREQLGPALNWKMEVICVDVFNREHRAGVKLALNQITSGTEYRSTGSQSARSNSEGAKHSCQSWTLTFDPARWRARIRGRYNRVWDVATTSFALAPNSHWLDLQPCLLPCNQTPAP